MFCKKNPSPLWFISHEPQIASLEPQIMLLNLTEQSNTQFEAYCYYKVLVFGSRCPL